MKRHGDLFPALLSWPNLMLAAKNMGYDTCPMVGFDFDKVAEIIRLPPDHIISMLVVVGKAAVAARDRSGQLPHEEVVFAERFPD